MSHLPLKVRVPIEADNPSICRDEDKCIKCGMCKEICTNDISVHGTYTLEATGNKAICIGCGQCANICPVNSITEKYEYGQVREAVKTSGKIVIVSTSPSVRAALGEEFGMPDGSFVEGKMISLLRALGVDYVLDTNFAADLTLDIQKRRCHDKKFTHHIEIFPFHGFDIIHILVRNLHNRNIVNIYFIFIDQM